MTFGSCHMHKTGDKSSEDLLELPGFLMSNLKVLVVDNIRELDDSGLEAFARFTFGGITGAGEAEWSIRVRVLKILR